MKEKVCKICGKERYKETYCFDCFKEVKRRYNKKYREKNLEEYNAKQRYRYYNTGKEYNCKNCNKKFTRKIKVLYCCNSCQFEHWKKEGTRKGKNNPGYRNGFYTNRTIKESKTVSKHKRACKKYRKKFLDENDYICCELCKVSNSIRFETHHIIFASEVPKHKELHNHKNLIMLCIKCHNTLHKEKRLRDKIVKERELETLFNKKFIYERKRLPSKIL